MRLPPRQALVFENLERVSLARGQRRKPVYMLDGENCHMQVSGLIVRGLIVRHESGRLARAENMPVTRPEVTSAQGRRVRLEGISRAL